MVKRGSLGWTNVNKSYGYKMFIKEVSLRMKIL